LKSRRFLALACAVQFAALSANISGADSTAARKPGWVDAERIASPSDSADNWLVHGRTYDESRHSPLNEINSGNVSKLGLAWSYATRTHRGLEATPIVVDGVLYATATWSVVFALDAMTGRELWRFDPKVPRYKARDTCCDVVNRGVAVWKGRVYVGTIDGRLIAIEAETGEPVWDVQTTDPTRPYTITGAPRIVKGLVVIGNSGADFGVRGFVTAYDAATGEQRWRFYTVPASKSGPHEHKELAIAAKTWPADSMWESGLGGTAWDAMAYDPQLNLLYVGTGNSSVYHREHRSPGGGDNLYLASILALRPETGELVWHYQTTPGEQWDYTATQQMILTDRVWQGRPRKLLLQAPKNGFFYVLDRETGELLSAEPFVSVSWASHVDLATGRPVEREEASWSDEWKIVTPHPIGAHSWHPMSFDSDRGTVYLQTFDMAYGFVPDHDFKFIPGGFNTGEDWTQLAELTEGMAPMKNAFCTPSRLVAWDIEKQEKKWEAVQDRTTAAGVLSTEGDLVFQGSVTGDFSAYHAETGEKLWSAPTGVSIMAAPVTYRANGEQYVVVLAGLGGAVGLQLAESKTTNAGRVFAFKLGGQAKMPPVEAKPEGKVNVTRIDASPETLLKGRAVYGQHCMRCHGPDATSTGINPDLRLASAEVHATWSDIVVGGTRTHAGMASFADLITRDEALAIQAWVVDRATHEPTALEQLIRWFPDSPFCIPASWTTD